MMCFGKSTRTIFALATVYLGYSDWIAAQAPNQGFAQQQTAQNAQFAQQAAQQAVQNNGQFQQAGQPAGLPGQPIGNPNVAPSGGGAMAIAQAPFPTLEPALEKYLNDVLGYWEKSTADIQRYGCNFKRWQFDPAQTKADFHYTYGEGVIRYATPDKGLFKVEKLLTYTTKDQAGKPQYQEFPNVFGEWWICDGVKVHNYDRTEKLVRQLTLPDEMQGKAIYNSPLPFFFGVEAAKIKERYWIRPLPPPTGTDGQSRTDLIYLEAFPKYQADAANYHKVHIMIDQREFLPAAIVIFNPQWNPSFPARDHFEFTERQKNFAFGDKLKETLFSQEFIPMQPPKDWKIVEEQVQPEQPLPGDRVASPVQQQTIPR